MIVRELITRLTECPQDVPVVLLIDQNDLANAHECSVVDLLLAMKSKSDERYSPQYYQLGEDDAEYWHNPSLVVNLKTG